MSKDPGTERDKVIWEYLQAGAVEADAVWRAYRENLDVVFSIVETRPRPLDCKIVITSAHRNLFGERLGPIPTRRKYGHSYGVRSPALVRVPWFTVKVAQRRLIRADPSLDV